MSDATLSPAARAALVRLLRAAYPHPDFPDGPYERAAEAVVTATAEDLWHRLSLAEGLRALDALAEERGHGPTFVGLDDEPALALLRELEDAEFFRFIRGVVVVALYDDAEVHELLGYEGPSFDKGGYLHRGFDDLDWLPDPRVEEYDGPEQLVEVAADDRPSSTHIGRETRS